MYVYKLQTIAVYLKTIVGHVWKELYITDYYYGANHLRRSITQSWCPMATREMKSSQLHQLY